MHRGCRGCLEKWHKISKSKTLTKEKIEYVVSVIMRWIETRYSIYDK
ncbi:MAG: DUF4186 family protein [Sedimentisphaerales bacterium]|nr:DUF4186 family protein [Sedimentisphaerales bacterium]